MVHSAPGQRDRQIADSLSTRAADPRRPTQGDAPLFAALHGASGEVTGKGYRHHCAVECKKFLALRDQSVPETHEVHRILDNDGIHKAALIHNGLRRRPRYPCPSRRPAPRG